MEPDYTEVCGCGRPLHYVNELTERLMREQVRRNGPLILVGEEDQPAYWVPRHYIALHGVTADGLPELAKRYGWERQRSS